MILNMKMSKTKWLKATPCNYNESIYDVHV